MFLAYITYNDTHLGTTLERHYWAVYIHADRAGSSYPSSRQAAPAVAMYYSTHTHTHTLPALSPGVLAGIAGASALSLRAGTGGGGPVREKETSALGSKRAPAVATGQGERWMD